MNRHVVRPLASDQNPRFKDLKKLLGGRGVRKSGHALVAGARQVAEILARHPDACRAWIGREDREPPPAGSPAHLEWLQLAPELFDLLVDPGEETNVFDRNPAVASRLSARVSASTMPSSESASRSRRPARARSSGSTGTG